MADKKVLLIVLGFVGSAIIFFIVWYFTKGRPFVFAIRNFIITMFVLFLLGLIVWAIVWIFKSQKVDMIEVMRRRVINACGLGAFDIPKKVVLMGYDKNQGFKLALKSMSEKGIIEIKDKNLMDDDFIPVDMREVGYCLGMARIRTDPMYKTFKKDDKEYKKLIRKPLDVTLFAFTKKLGKLYRFFNPPTIFAGFDGDYSDINGDVIKLFDSAFSPNLYGFLFLSRHYRDTNKIDETVKELIFRYVVQENLQDTKNLMDASYAIADKYRKEEIESIARALKAQGASSTTKKE